MFLEDEYIHNFELLDAVKEETNIWISEEIILENLNENMSREDVEKLCTPMDEIYVSEIDIFEAVVTLYNKKF